MLLRILIDDHNVCEPSDNGTGGCEYCRIEREGYLQWFHFGDYLFQMSDAFGRCLLIKKKKILKEARFFNENRNRSKPLIRCVCITNLLNLQCTRELKILRAI